jgi:hypothetical protein
MIKTIGKVLSVRLLFIKKRNRPVTPIIMTMVIGCIVLTDESIETIRHRQPKHFF